MDNDNDKHHVPKSMHEAIPDEIKKLLEESSKSRAGLSEALGKLTDMVDYLRVIINYQTFDLEATRRERNYYMKKWEDAGGDIDGR